MMREIQGTKTILTEKEGAVAGFVAESGIKAESAKESELPTQSVDKPSRNAQQAQLGGVGRSVCWVVETQTTTESGRAVTVYGIRRGNFRAEDLCDNRAAVEQFCHHLNETDVSAEHLPDLLADFVAEQYFV